MSLKLPYSCLFILARVFWSFAMVGDPVPLARESPILKIQCLWRVKSQNSISCLAPHDECWLGYPGLGREIVTSHGSSQQGSQNPEGKGKQWCGFLRGLNSSLSCLQPSLGSPPGGVLCVTVWPVPGRSWPRCSLLTGPHGCLHYWVPTQLGPTWFIQKTDVGQGK